MSHLCNSIYVLVLLNLKINLIGLWCKPCTFNFQVIAAFLAKRYRNQLYQHSKAVYP